MLVLLFVFFFSQTLILYSSVAFENFAANVLMDNFYFSLKYTHGVKFAYQLFEKVKLWKSLNFLALMLINFFFHLTAIVVEYLPVMYI